ncbi:hypothetical protein QQ045_012268 [Rhodiola kirilowii]
MVGGEVLEDGQELVNAIREHFKAGRELTRPYTWEEVKRALFQMAPLKAPGIDGFPALFFHRNWNTVGDRLCQEVLSFLNGGHFDKRLNCTRITLVPKVKDTKRIEDYRPISVCNTTV